MNGKRHDLLIAGELNPDAILLSAAIEVEYGQVERLVDDGVLTVGSSGGIVACGAVRLGMRTAYVGTVGDDAAGQFMLGELRARGVDVEACRVDPVRRTGLSVVLSRGDDRAILTSPGAMAGLTAADVTDEMLVATRRLHISSPNLQDGLRDGLADLLRRAREAGAGTSLDPGWDPTGSWGPDLDQALDGIDVFLPNAVEACRFANAEEPHVALDKLAERIGTVVVKLGSEGAIAKRGDEIARVAAPSVDAVDSTGAGDSFTAGFLYGLGGEASLEEALRLGVACGSLSTRGIGGVDTQPTPAEAAAVANTIASGQIERNNA